jgi:hypothetical protein
VTAGTPSQGWTVCVIRTVNYIKGIITFREWFGESAVIKKAHKAEDLKNRHGKQNDCVGILSSNVSAGIDTDQGSYILSPP